MHIFIGIDPGAGGGLVFLIEGQPGRDVALGPEVVALKMPSTERDLLEVLDEGFVAGAREGERLRPVHAVLEHVWSIPGQGGAFAFGKNVGALMMALTAARIPFDQVLPRRWQKALGVAYPAGATDTEKKNITKRRAQQLFPGLTITHAIADALLIAEYCRRSYRGTHGEEGKGRGETREEFERDRAGETGERNAKERQDAKPGGRGARPAPWASPPRKHARR